MQKTTLQKTCLRHCKTSNSNIGSVCVYSTTKQTKIQCSYLQVIIQNWNDWTSSQTSTFITYKWLQNAILCNLKLLMQSNKRLAILQGAKTMQGVQPELMLILFSLRYRVLFFEFWIKNLGFIVVENFMGWNCGLMGTLFTDVILEAYLKEAPTIVWAVHFQ